MAVPKKRRSLMKRRHRRAQQALTVAQYNVCPNCKSAIQPHALCPQCGHYKGKEIIRIGQL